MKIKAIMCCMSAVLAAVALVANDDGPWSGVSGDTPLNTVSFDAETNAADEKMDTRTYTEDLSDPAIRLNTKKIIGTILLMR